MKKKLAIAALMGACLSIMSSSVAVAVGVKTVCGAPVMPICSYSPACSYNLPCTVGAVAGGCVESNTSKDGCKEATTSIDCVNRDCTFTSCVTVFGTTSIGSTKGVDIPRLCD